MLSFASVRQLWNLPVRILLVSLNIKKQRKDRKKWSWRSYSETADVSLLSVAVAVRHGEDVAVEDAKLRVEGQDGVFALVVFAAAAVGV